MPLNTESIIALLTLIVTIPPMIAMLYAMYNRLHRNTSKFRHPHHTPMTQNSHA
jgi:hypothetical protein